MTTNRTEKPLNLILTFGAFIGVLCAVVVGIVLWKSPTKEISTTGIEQSESEDFFYKSIGQSPSTPKMDPKSGGNRFTLEIKVTGSRTEAEKTINQLRKQRIKAYYTPLNRGGRIVYRVRTGIFESQANADKASISLRSGKEVANRVIKL